MNDRDATIARIRTALRRRSGKAWSVTGGRGTAWGWIRVDAPPVRRTWFYYLPDGQIDQPGNYLEHDTGNPTGHMGPDERAELGSLLGLDGPVHHQGHRIPASSDYYTEAVDRAEGRVPSVIGQPYWED